MDLSAEGLEKTFRKIINCSKGSDIVAVKLPDMVFSINVLKKIWSINILLESLILAGCVIWGRQKCEDKKCKEIYLLNDGYQISLSQH